MKKCLALAIAAGAASSFASSSALAAKTETPEIGRAYSAGSVYVNAKTGERVVLKGFESREGPERWNNRDSTNNGNFFSGIDNPTRSTTSVRPRFGAEVLDTGDIAAAPGVGALVDGFRLSYATDIAGVLSDATVPGLDMTIWFYDNDNSTLNNDTRAQALAGFVIGDLNGTQGTFNSWSFTIDLAGGDEIQLGDQDLDGDGGLDFGWSIAFQQNQTTPAKGTIGPTLVLPGGYGYTNGVNSTSTSTGVKNGWEWFAPLVFNSSGQAAAGHQTYLTSTTTTWAASVPPSASGFQPFLSTAIILYGAESCAADFNGDGFIDFTDFDDFVFAFEGGDPSSDFNQDGFLHFTDFDAFVAAFEAGC
jgi:hypothetical protein